MALEVSQLLTYLDSSPFGSLRLKKLDLKDFVLVGGDSLRLVDLDELMLGQMQCHSADQCQVEGLDKGRSDTGQSDEGRSDKTSVKHVSE